MREYPLSCKYTIEQEAMWHNLYYANLQDRGLRIDAMLENLYTTNLPPEVKREYSISYKFTAGGNAWISFTLQIYYRR